MWSVSRPCSTGLAVSVFKLVCRVFVFEPSRIRRRDKPSHGTAGPIRSAEPLCSPQPTGGKGSNRLDQQHQGS